MQVYGHRFLWSCAWVCAKRRTTVRVLCHSGFSRTSFAGHISDSPPRASTAGRIALDGAGGGAPVAALIWTGIVGRAALASWRTRPHVRCGDANHVTTCALRRLCPGRGPAHFEEAGYGFQRGRHMRCQCRRCGPWGRSTAQPAEASRRLDICGSPQRGIPVAVVCFAGCVADERAVRRGLRRGKEVPYPWRAAASCGILSWEPSALAPQHALSLPRSSSYFRLALSV